MKNMNKKTRKLGVLWIVIAMLLCFTGCGNNNDSDVRDRERRSSNEEDADSDRSDREAADSNQEDDTSFGIAILNDLVDVTNLKPSDGLEFESNGDGTCAIVGIGSCTDKDLVIPKKSPDGDTVILIDERAFSGLEDVDSVTLLNYNYEVGRNAFCYGEFTTLNIIGGSPVIKRSAFSSCEDLTSILFSDCNIQADEYAFYYCGKDADVTFSNCTGAIDERAFQYSDFISLSISNCELEIGESAFSSCEELTSIVFTDSMIEAGEYAFYYCGDSAVVEMINCSLVLDDRAFQYSSLDSLTITGSKVEMGDSVFSGCEDLAVVTIDCELITLGEYAFYNCDELADVSICENLRSDNEIKIDDRAFQYCESLEAVTIGKGNIEIGEYVFSGCDDSLTITIAGKSYTADAIEDGLK